LFLHLDVRAITPFAAAGDVVGDLEHLDMDVPHAGTVELLSMGQIEHCLEDGLGVYLGVVLLDRRARDRLEVLARPVDLHALARRLEESLRALEDVEWTGDAAPGEP